MLLIQNCMECCLLWDSLRSRWMVLRANVPHFCKKVCIIVQTTDTTPIKIYTISREIVYFTHHQTDFCNRYQCIKSGGETCFDGISKKSDNDTHSKMSGETKICSLEAQFLYDHTNCYEFLICPNISFFSRENFTNLTQIL